MSFADLVNKHWDDGKKVEIPTDGEPIKIIDGIKFVLSTPDRVQEDQRLATKSKNDDLTK